MFLSRHRTLHILAIALAAIVLALETPRAQERSFDLLTASLADIQATVDAGKLTYEGLVGLYLKRIEAYDKQGPRLNAVITVNPRALEIARELDVERKASPTSRSPAPKRRPQLTVSSTIRCGPGRRW